MRNAATVGGNLLQRTRCAYFYDTASACNKRRPGAGCDACHGANRLHAVLGWSEACIATHPSDFCVPLVALDAVTEIEGKTGRREVRVEDLHRLPGDTPALETLLEPGDLIVAIRLPAGATAFSAHARYLKVRERTSYAFAVVSSPRRSISNPAISDRLESPSAGSLPALARSCSRSDTHRRAGG